MTKLLLILAVAYLVYLFFRRKSSAGKVETASPEADVYLDPVCGVYIPADEAVVGRVADTRIYFCSTACLEKYREQLGQSAEKEKERQ